MRLVWIGMALLLCTAVFAQGNVPVYAVGDDGVPDDPTDLAFCWEGTGYTSFCNADRCVDIGVRASVAQWLQLYLEATQVAWRILKPGDYAIDTLHGSVNSNGDVSFDFDGFEDLANVEGDIIETYYALFLPAGNQVPSNDDWMRAADVNAWDPYLVEDEGHQGYSFDIWQRLIVIPCDSACEYADEARICARLEEQKDWVDRETGLYDPDAPPPTFPNDIAIGGPGPY